MKCIFDAFKFVYQQYLNRGFKITLVLVDGEFAALQALIHEMNNGPRVNLTSANEHVPEAERRIRVVKERVRANRHDLPFTRIPKLMLIHMVFDCVTMLNFFPAKGGIAGISPKLLLTGVGLNKKQHFRQKFGSYCQVHEENQPRNSMDERTAGAICLGHSGNIQGGHKFLSLRTGRIITRRSWTALPMPDDVIARVDALGADQPELLTFYDRRGRLVGDIELTGVYGEHGEYDELATPVVGDPGFELNEYPPDEEFFADAADVAYDPETPDLVDSENDDTPVIPVPAPVAAPVDVPEGDDDPEIPGIPVVEEPAAEPAAAHPHQPPGVLRRSNRVRFAPQYYKPSVRGKSYLMNQITEYAEMLKEQVLHPDWHIEIPEDDILACILTQVSMRKGLTIWGKSAREAIKSEVQQMHYRDTFEPLKYEDLTAEEKQQILESHLFLTEKRDKTIKGRLVAGGDKQKDFITKEDKSSPTVATEAVLLTCAIDAAERRDVAVADLPNAFIQTRVFGNDRVIVRLRGEIVKVLLELAPNVYGPYVTIDKKGVKCLLVRCLNAIYGTVVASLLFYKKLRASLESFGFEFNPYDPCVGNKMIDGKQMTICIHVDDCKISHVDSKAVDEMIEWLRDNYEVIWDDGTGKMKVSRGKVHKYLGMTLDYSVDGQCMVTMIPYIQDILAIYKKAVPGALKKKKSAAPVDLFTVDESCMKLEPAKAKTFHNLVAKTLFATKRARPDTCTAVAYLTTRVLDPDIEDWRKMTHMMEYLHETQDLPLILSANNMGVVKWWVDGSFAVHPNMRGHTGGGMSLGRGFPIVHSTKHKLNTRSSTEAELVSVDDCMPAICWTRYFLQAQGYAVNENIVYQDNKSAILLETNGKASSSKRTKHINVRYFFVTDRVAKQELNVEWCPTGDMIADFMTKPLQGALFKKFRDLIMGVRSLASVDTPTPQECIGGRTPKDMVTSGTSNKRLANEWTVVMKRKRRSSNTTNSDG
jgi:hypothetical protein